MDLAVPVGFVQKAPLTAGLFVFFRTAQTVPGTTPIAGVASPYLAQASIAQHDPP